MAPFLAWGGNQLAPGNRGEQLPCTPTGRYYILCTSTSLARTFSHKALRPSLLSSHPQPLTTSQLNTMPSAEPAEGAAAPAVTSSPPPQVPDGLTAVDESDGQAQCDGDSGLHKGEQAKKKKKKMKKSRGNKSTAQRGPTALPKNRGTGFEEYFADPPMTPQEYAEEQDEIYAPDLPFEERIQSCIQRFRSRRRLQEEHTRFFNEYLFLGGIDTSNNAFIGQDEKDLKALTPAERRDATATDVVHGGSATNDRFYNGDGEHWSVDFTGVAAGFFSTSLIWLTGGKAASVDAAIGVVDNFLRYTLQHDVCPEYEGDIKSALQLCTQARTEWRVLDQLRPSLPGPFNMAATDLFSPPIPGDWSCPTYSRPEGFDAKRVFYSVCALVGAVDALESIRRRGPKATKEYTCTLEVVEHDRVAKDTMERFKRLKVGDDDDRVAPVGRALFKPATIDDGWENPPAASVDGAGIWLYFEDATLAKMPLGVKMTLTIIELDVGIRFVKAFSNVVPSFYTFLPQELMKHYKLPRDNERPAPSVHNPEAEEKQHAREAHED
ncbi:Argonaute-binding protein 1 [Tolypocladium ophioglossoides CBS 100239]|uniref:Argonaute-binding protein 1 n=1 Tax=Tolypocladium ophioglossoides (strain CBS 100239) TaxID=1163406 RepID=A0A0L0MZJ7_TOLOC|nr:Argonaute-binding protein 1 [Tolypocladium ophioglossoides CBS 100239]